MYFSPPRIVSTAVTSKLVYLTISKHLSARETMVTKAAFVLINKGHDRILVVPDLDAIVLMMTEIITVSAR